MKKEKILNLALALSCGAVLGFQLIGSGMWITAVTITVILLAIKQINKK